MSVSSQATFYFKSKEQMDAIESFPYELEGNFYKGKHFKDVARMNNDKLTCSFSNCFCYIDMKNECLTKFCLHIASCVPSFSFECTDARFENDSDGTVYSYEFFYHSDKALVDVSRSFFDPGEMDEYTEYYAYTFVNGEWIKEEA